MVPIGRNSKTPRNFICRRHPERIERSVFLNRVTSNEIELVLVTANPSVEKFCTRSYDDVRCAYAFRWCVIIGSTSPAREGKLTCFQVSRINRNSEALFFTEIQKRKLRVIREVTRSSVLWRIHVFWVEGFHVP